MIRAAFLSAGLYAVLCGAGCLFVDDVQLSSRVPGEPAFLLNLLTQVDSEGRRHVHPPEWIPFTLMGLGGVTMLYAVALPRS